MSLRSKFKVAVKQIRAATDEFWIEIELFERKSTSHLDYDPSDPTKNNDPVSTIVRAFESVYKEGLIDGDRIQQGDRAFIIDADHIVDVSLIDYVEVDGVKHDVISYRLVQQDIYWKIQIRKGG